MFSDFYAGIIVARQVDGVKFALGQTIVTTRSRIAGFGGYQQLENRPGDDLLVGRSIVEQGYEVKLLPYTVGTVSDYKSIWDLLQKRLRWIVVMRHMRPWGHLGLLLTQGLPWSVAAVAIHPTPGTALGYFGAYVVLRLATTWTIGVWGLAVGSRSGRVGPRCRASTRHYGELEIKNLMPSSALRSVTPQYPLPGDHE
jgi:ceramide glucosyltransferase